MSFDVLVIGSGAWASRPRSRCPRRRARRRRDEGDVRRATPPRRRAGSRPRSGPTTRPSSTPTTSGAPRTRRPTARLVEILTGDAPAAIGWLEELGVAFTREDGGYRSRAAAARPAKRLLQVGDRTGHAITKALREAYEASDGTVFAEPPAARPRAHGVGLARARSSTTASSWTSTRRPSSSPPAAAASGGRGARRALDEPSRARPARSPDRARARRGGARPRRAAVPPERRRLAARPMQGTRSPRRRAPTALCS